MNAFPSIPAALPLFPLPLALFPGTPQLLHVFEPRYRQLVEDCMAGERRFGLSCLGAGRSDPEPGDVGCVARIVSHQALPDGRSNLLTNGESRFEITALVPTDRLYRVAHVQAFDDDPADPAGLADLAREAWTAFRALAALLNADPMPPAVAPADPRDVSFAVAGALEMDVEIKERLLRTRSTGDRLRRLISLVNRFRTGLEPAAGLQATVRRNGNGRPPTPPPSPPAPAP